MTAANVPLRETVTITLNGVGAGTAKVGPLSAREIWHPSNVSVSANTNPPVNDATCSIFVGDANTQTFRDSCIDGSSGDSTDKCNADQIKCGQYVWAVWSGGDANVRATLTVTGTKDI